MRKVRESSMSLLRSVIYGSLVLTVLGSAAAIGRPRADVVVSLDQAKLLRLPDKTATIVVGNPLIADASLQAGGQIVITGKGLRDDQHHRAGPGGQRADE
jgi:Flp pilus assembly secretin CpaC